MLFHSKFAKLCCWVVKFPHLYQTATMHVLPFNKAFPVLLIYSLLSRLQRSWPLRAHTTLRLAYSHTLHTSDSSFKAATPPHSNTPSCHLITYTLHTFQQSHSISQNIPTCAMLQFNHLHMYHAQFSTIQFSAETVSWILNLYSLELYFSLVPLYWCRVSYMVFLKTSVYEHPIFTLIRSVVHSPHVGHIWAKRLFSTAGWSSSANRKYCSHGSATWTQFFMEC